jgi:hypothetical protein
MALLLAGTAIAIGTLFVAHLPSSTETETSHHDVGFLNNTGVSDWIWSE